MKKLNIVLAIAATICAGVFSACSDEPEAGQTAKNDPAGFVQDGGIVTGKINLDALSRHTSGLKDATYTLENFETFNMDDYTNGLWEKKDLRLYDGWEMPMPRRIAVIAGEYWEPIRTFSLSTGPTRFGIALDLIERVEHKDYSIYIKKKMATDDVDKTLTIGHRKYGILYADDEALVLSYEYPYYGGRTHNGGLEMIVTSYSLSDPLQFEGTVMDFDSETAAYDWIIEVFRNKFGESVNRNDYYNGVAILDYPMFYLEEIIAERDLLGGREEPPPQKKKMRTMSRKTYGHCPRFFVCRLSKFVVTL